MVEIILIEVSIGAKAVNPRKINFILWENARTLRVLKSTTEKVSKNHKENKVWKAQHIWFIESSEEYIWRNSGIKRI